MLSDWQKIDASAKDGRVVEITVLEADGTPFEIWPMQWGHIQKNGLFAPGQIGMWVAGDGSMTWREGDGGPTHYREIDPANPTPPTVNSGDGT